MNGKERVDQYNEMVDMLLQKNTQLANDVDNYEPAGLIAKATAIKLAIENAHTLKNLLFNYSTFADRYRQIKLDVIGQGRYPL